MKKLIITLIATSMTMTSVFAEETVVQTTTQPISVQEKYQTQLPAQKPVKYELGKYDFSFGSNDQVVIPTPVLTPQNSSTQNPVKPINSSNIKTQKQIINQIKNDEAVKLKEEAKQASDKVEKAKTEAQKTIKTEADKAQKIIKETESASEKNIEKTLDKVDVTKNEAKDTIQKESDNAKKIIKRTETQAEDKIERTFDKVDVTKNEAQKTIKKETEKVQQSIQKTETTTINKFNQEKNKLKDKAKNKTKQKSKADKKEKKVKYDNDTPPHRFEIRPVQYKGSSSSSKIESL